MTGHAVRTNKGEDEDDGNTKLVNDDIAVCRNVVM